MFEASFCLIVAPFVQVVNIEREILISEIGTVFVKFYSNLGCVVLHSPVWSAGLAWPTRTTAIHDKHRLTEYSFILTPYTRCTVLLKAEPDYYYQYIQNNFQRNF